MKRMFNTLLCLASMTAAASLLLAEPVRGA